MKQLFFWPLIVLFFDATLVVQPPEEKSEISMVSLKESNVNDNQAQQKDDHPDKQEKREKISSSYHKIETDEQNRLYKLFCACFGCSRNA